MYFLRIIGASLISFTVIIMGFMKSNRYKINLQFLNELIEMIEYYKNSVRFTKNDVATVLNEYKNQNIRLIDESEINVDICSKCHPFYTGKQSRASRAGRVDKFNKKYGFDKKEA